MWFPVVSLIIMASNGLLKSDVKRCDEVGA